MKYIAPYGETDIDAPYINGDPSIGRMGSIPPAAAFEHPMRELVQIITNNKLTPDEDDLKQVSKGIRSQRSNYVEDTGSVNALSVALDPPLTSYTIGLPLRVKVANTNTGTSTINAGAGTVAIRKPTGAAVGAGDLPSGGLVELVYDGTAFQMINFGGAGDGGGDTETFLVNVPYTVDAGTTNTVIANFSPAITALVPGTIFMVKIAHTNTSFANINVNGLGLKAIHAQGASPNWPLLPGDLAVGDVLIFTYDGTRFWVYANTVLNQNHTFNVSNNTQINELFVALGRKRIHSDVSVLIVMATGIYGAFTTYHPDASRITVQGTMLAANPIYNDFAKTGHSPAARASDAANNIAMLRTRYGTEIQFGNAQFGGTVLHSGPGRITFKNLLVTGSNISAGNAAGYLVGIAPAGGASCQIVGCAVWGSGGGGIGTGGGSSFCHNSFAVGNWLYGFGAGLGSTMELAGCGAYGNNVYGLMCDRGGSLNTVSRFSVVGLPDIPGTQSMGSGGVGLVCAEGSSASISAGNITGNATDVHCYNMSSVSLSKNNEVTPPVSPVYGSLVPAANTIGNNNSIISVI